ncbi:MAG: hypothetical protein KDC10_11250 [Calditrichaeota bacterium]|nr:hypothetical protein [Calditrichota bacterium]
MKHWLLATMAFMVVGVAQAQLQDAQVGGLLDEAQVSDEAGDNGDYVLGFRLPKGRPHRIWINSNARRWVEFQMKDILFVPSQAGAPRVTKLANHLLHRNKGDHKSVSTAVTAAVFTMAKLLARMHSDVDSATHAFPLRVSHKNTDTRARERTNVATC